MEIHFLDERATELDPKLLIDHTQRMASGEAPFFPTTLSLVYDKLIEKSFTNRTPFDPGPGGCTKGESLIHPSIPLSQALASTCSILPAPIVETIASSSNLQTPAPTYGPILPITTPNSAWLKCQKCGEVARLRDLHESLRCPRCPTKGKKGRPFMECTSCYASQATPRDNCVRKKCRKRFM